MAEDFNYALGQRLRAARRQRGWSLVDVEGHTGGEFKASVVGAYERGERAISVQRFVRLAEVYGFPPADLLPISVEPQVTIDLNALDDADGDQRVEGQPAGVRERRVLGGIDDREGDLAEGRGGGGERDQARQQASRARRYARYAQVRQL